MSSREKEPGPFSGRFEETADAPAMPDIDSFETFFQKELRPFIRPHERRRILLAFLIAVAPSAAFTGTYLLLDVLAGTAGPRLLQLGIIRVLFSLFVAFAGFIVAYASFKKSGYALAFKSDIIPKVAKAIHPSLEYYPSGGIPWEIFRQTELFLAFNSQYHVEDYFRGRVGKTVVEFCDLALLNGNSRSPDDAFQGLYFVADFNKEFKGRTYILPNKTGKEPGWLGRMVQKYHLLYPDDLVELEDADFSRLFVVYSDDQLEARYLLTPSLMERLMSFRARRGEGIRFSLVGSRLHAVIPTSRNSFEPPLLSSLFDFDLYREFFDDIHLCLDAIDDLNLNRRIWSKGETSAEPCGKTALP